jgi:hypothetical protein
MTDETGREPASAAAARPGPVPPNPALSTGYHAEYVRLAGERRRFSSFDPLGPGLAAGDGAQGGMHDADHAAGRPSRRERELAAWLTAEVPEQLRGAQFDIATALAKIEQLRDSQWMATRNMLEAERRAYEAEQRARETEEEGALGRLASRYAILSLAAAALERENALLRAAACEDCQQPGRRPVETAAGAVKTPVDADFPGVDLDMLAVDIAGMLSRHEYPIDAADNHIRPALPAFIAAILSSAAADTGSSDETAG